MLTFPLKAKAESASYYFNQGKFKFKVEDDYGAIADQTKAIEINPNVANAYYNSVISKKLIGDYLGAIDDYTKALKINSRYVLAYRNRADAKIKIGDMEGACFDVKEAQSFGYNNSSKEIKFLCRNY